MPISVLLLESMTGGGNVRRTGEWLATTTTATTARTFSQECATGEGGGATTAAPGTGARLRGPPTQDGLLVGAAGGDGGRNVDEPAGP